MKYLTITLILLVGLFGLLPMARSGTITNWGIRAKHQNNVYAKTITITLSIENGLLVDEYLRIVFPYSLHTSLLVNNPSGVSARYYLYDTVTGLYSNSVILKTTILKRSGEVANAYYFQFLDSTGKVVALQALQGYAIEITGNTAPQGNQGPLIVQTVSTFEDSFLVYDENKIFGMIDIGLNPPATLNLNSFSDNIARYQIGATYDVYIDITSNVEVLNQAQFEITMTNPLFKFSGSTCSSIDIPAPIVKALPVEVYKCVINNVENTIVLSINQTVPVGQKIRLQLFVTNPNVLRDGGFEVKLRHYYNFYIEERNELNSALTTNQLAWQYDKILLGWGVDLSRSDLPPAVRVMKTDNDFDTNALKFSFTVTDTSLNNLELQVVLSYGDDASNRVLRGTITENLPACPAKEVLCNDDSVNKKIICEQVCGLRAGSTYFIALRMRVNSDPAAIFGNFEVFPRLSTKEFDTIPLYPRIVPPFVIPTATATNYGSTKSGITISVSSNAGGVPITSLNYGLQYSTSEQYLIFSFGNSDSLPALTGTGGLEIYSGSAIEPQSGTVGHYPTLSGGNDAAITVQSLAQDTSDGKMWTRIRLGGNLDAAISEMMRAPSLSPKDFGINKIKIQKYNIGYADQNTVDFYGAFSTIGLTASGDSPSPSTSFVLNGYLFTPGNPLPNLNVIATNLWADTAGLDGTKFPAFLRVSGYLDDSEKLNTVRLAVFFSSGSAFQKATVSTLYHYSQGTEVTCIGSINVKCYQHNNGKNTQPTELPYTNSRIDIDIYDSIGGISSTNPFSVIIPITTVASTPNVWVSVATLGREDVAYPGKKYFKIQSIKKLTQISGTSGAQATATNLNPDINGKSYVVGSTQASLDLKIALNSASFSANTGSSTGAAIVFASDWNFMADPGFAIASSTATSQLGGDTKCLNFTYWITNKNRYAIYCPVTSAISSATVSLTKFVLPWSNGLKLPANTVGAASQNTGAFLQSYEYGTGTDLVANVLTISSFNPTLQKNKLSERIQLTFKTSSNIPKTGQLMIDTTGTFLFSITGSICELKTSLGASIQSHTCTQVSGSTAITWSLTADNDFPAGEYSIWTYGVNVGSTATGSTTFRMSTKTNDGTVIDQTAAYSGTITYVETAFTAELGISNPLYTFNQFNATSPFSVNFLVPGKNIYYVDRLKLDLSPVVSGNTLSEIACSVYVNGIISHDWKKCEFATTVVTLTPKTDLTSMTTNYQLVLTSVKVPVATQPADKLFGSLTSSIDAGIVLQKTSVNGVPIPTINPKALITFNNLLFTKNHNQAGAFSTLRFIYTSPILNTTNNTRFFVLFPNDYDPKLTSIPLNCKINNTDTLCNVEGPRLLVVYFLNGAIPDFLSGSPFQIEVIGVAQPAITSSKRYFIGLTNGITNQLQEFGDVTDPISSAIGGYNIGFYNFTLSSNDVSSLSTYTFLMENFFDKPRGALYLIFRLPTAYKTFFNSREIGCYYGLVNRGAFQTQVPCQVTNSSINMTINNSTYFDSSNQWMQFKLVNVPTPLVPTQNYDNIGLTVIDSSKPTITKYVASHTRKNSNKQYFRVPEKSDTSLELLKFIYASDRTQISRINLYSGIFSPELIITPVNSSVYFGRNIQFFYSDRARAVLTPSQLMVRANDKELRFRIGYRNYDTPGLLEINFLKVEALNPIFDMFPIMFLNLVNNSAQTISPDRSSYSLPKGGTTFPIIIDITNIPPVEEIWISAKIELAGALNNTNSLSIISSNNQSYRLGATRGQYMVSAGSDALPGVSRNLVFTINGPNAASYVMNPYIIPITVVPDIDPIYYWQNKPPFLNVSNNTQSSKTSSFDYSILVDQYSTYYWALSLNGRGGRSYQYVQDRVKEGFVFKGNLDPRQEQFGYYYFSAPNTTINFKLTRLLAGQNYTLKYWVGGQFVDQVTEGKIDFTTNTSGARSFSTQLNFVSMLSLDDVNSVTCLLAEYLSYTFNRVMLSSGSTCVVSTSTSSSSSSRLLQNTTNTTNTTSNTTTNTTNTTTPSGSTSSNNTSPVVNTTTNTAENRSAPFTNQLIYYLLPDLSADSSNPDNDLSYLIQKLNKTIDFKTFLRERNKTLPGLDSVLAIRNISNSRPIIQNNSLWNIKSGSRTISFQNMTINTTDGFFYVAVSNENKTTFWNNLPFSAWELVTLNSSLVSQGFVDSVNRYDINATQIFNVINLESNRNYKAYFWASTENPSGLGNNTEIFTFAFKTTSFGNIINFMGCLLVSIIIMGVLII